MIAKPIHFIRRGQQVVLTDVPPTRTLLQVLREDLTCTGTKEGCAEGDCGACTVVLGELVPPAAGSPVLSGDGPIKYSAINSCIRLAHSIDGMALWTVEDLTLDPLLKPSSAKLPPNQLPLTQLPRARDTLHPVQQALVQCHASQCGFCTPGFVMSLFGMYQNRVCQGEPVSREMALEDLSGNLCRCTGYRPILDAAQTMETLPGVRVDENKLLQQLKQINHAGRGIEPDLPYLLPQNLSQLLAARKKHPQAQIVAGCTDVGLWVNKLHMDFAQVLDVTQVRELRRVEKYPHHIAIGAAATLAVAFAALTQNRPQLHSFANRFAGVPVRNSGTLGGNVANGSPIGDSMPLLIALEANVVLMREQRGKAHHREMPLEDFYTGYRKNVLAADEVLAWIKVPKATDAEFTRIYKISKRFDDDISAVCLALTLRFAEGRVIRASIGVGGVAATPVRASKTEAALTGQPWNLQTVKTAQAVLRSEFAPISDMRASNTYRTQVLGNLLHRFWLEESAGTEPVNLESPKSLDYESFGIASRHTQEEPAAEYGA
jgi:xanthine dehydrogenase small subunit